MLRILNKEGIDPQKKLITFQNAALMNGMISAEGAATNQTDSGVVEQHLISDYLNKDDQIASALATNLFQENGMVKTLKAINQIFIEHPEYANNSLLTVLRFAKRLAQEYPSEMEMSDERVIRLAGLASELHSIVSRQAEADASYKFQDADNVCQKYIDNFDLIQIKDVAEAATVERRLTMENVLYLGLSSIINLWNFGGVPEGSTIKNWKGTYLIIDSILDLSVWNDHPAFKYEFALAVKEIELEKGKRDIFDSTIPPLSKMVCLKNKILNTTEDAVILKSESEKPSEYFDNARRIIHGPGQKNTKKPYIILFSGEADRELDKLVEELVKDFSEEFPDAKDSFAVPILYDGNYFDKRIIWRTV